MHFMEKAVIPTVCFIVVLGVILSYIDVSAFENGYIKEDGLIEWGTVPSLVLGAFVCFRRVVLLRTRKPVLFLAATLLFGLMFIFGTGEEISWGKRMFGFRSPAWFEEYNAQHDTTIHNLKFGHVKINKLVFSQGLGAVIFIYALLLPLLYWRGGKAARVIAALAIPIPQPRHILLIAFVILLVYGAVSSSGRGELAEFGLSWTIALCFMFPLNAIDFLECPIST